MPDEPLREDTLELANHLLEERLASQKAGIERIETKATLLMGFAVVGAQFVVREARGGWTAAAVISYLLALAFGVIAIALYEHDEPPRPSRLVEAYLGQPRASLLDVLVRTREAAFYTNQRHALRKRRAWIATLGFVAVAVLLSATALWREV